MSTKYLKGFTGNHIKVTIDSPDLNIETAQDFAKQKAREVTDDPMLLSWFCGITGDYHPKTECGPNDRPPWIVFAESRDADLAININNGDYLFLYLSF